MTPLRWVFCALFLCLVTSGLLWGQGGATAQISGTVKDQSGAVLPGAEVTLTQTETGLMRNAVTNETGSYTLTNLPIGPYRLEASLPGFRTYVQNGIVLQVNSNPVINSTLEVGQVSETVEVQANAALVETRNTGIGQVIDNQRVLELPLNGRQVAELVQLSGMATVVANGTINSGTRNYPTTVIVVAGGLQTGVNYLLDGAVHEDPYSNLSLPLPFPDALQEFKIETSALTAQYGRHSSAAVSAVSKAGTNAFHGDLFEFVRNGSFNARNAYALTRDSLKRNQFGGTIGGPIRKNKLFFFGGLQYTTQRSAPTEAIAFIPSTAMLAGDWTSVASPACNNGRQINMLAPFGGNRISPSLFSPIALNFMKRMPTTDDPCGRIQFGRRRNEDEKSMIGRADYQVNQKHSLFGRFINARRDSPTDYDGKNPLTVTITDLHQRAYSFVLGETYLIDTNTVNSFRSAVLVTENPKPPPVVFTLADIGVKNVWTPQPILRFSMSGGGFNITQADTVKHKYNSTIWQLSDDLALVRGTHQVDIGTSYVHSMMNGYAGINEPGSFSFNATNTGLVLGDFMLGKPNQFAQGNPGLQYPRQNTFGLYTQDTWKAHPRLTLNAGLRWEPGLGVYNNRREFGHFDPDAFTAGIRSTIYKNAPAGEKYPGDPGMNGKKLFKDRWMHFGPRVGLAWDPTGSGKTTVRGAYGIFYDMNNFLTYIGTATGTPPFGNIIAVNNPSFEDPWNIYPGGNPFPFYITPNSPFLQFSVYANFPTNIRTTTIQQWNLNIQRQVGSDWLLAANYIGSLTTHLWNAREMNAPAYIPGASCVIAGRTFSPCSSVSNANQRRPLYLQNPDAGQYYGSIQEMNDGGTGTYHALFLSAQRRIARGLTVQGNYTLSHCIGDPPNQQLAGNPGSPVGGRERVLERGNCAGDRRHLFNLSTVVSVPQFSNRALKAVASGWQLSGIVRLQSGQPFSIASGVDSLLSTQGGQRPNQVLASPYSAVKDHSQWLNPAAFAQAATGAYGNLGPFNIFGPGTIRIDMGLVRTFQVRENQSLQFRAESFNLPNHVNPGNPVSTLTQGTFGRIQTGDDPRIMQFAVKYLF